MRCREAGDEAAAHRLITSHLRLAAKIALGYRGYGLPLSDIISEGNLGLLKAVRRFDPDRGARLATYATWWIRAQIQDYVLRSWSLVKIGTTAAQKKLFFNLARSKAALHSYGERELSPSDVQLIATELAVPEGEVVSMNGRLSASDASLNVPPREGDGEWQDRIVDEGDDQETRLADREMSDARRMLMRRALTQLTGREREIIEARRLRDEPTPLAVIAQRHGVSPERIRQIELRALAKLQKLVSQSSQAPSPIALPRAA
jgi:RNA polymerase sigma-32 factor